MAKAKQQNEETGPVVFGAGDPNAPILVNLAGLIFTVSQESGVFLQSIERSISSTREDVFDVSKGYDVGFVNYNNQATWTIKGRVSAINTGVSAAAPGVVLALVNNTGIWTGNGVSAGGVYTETIAVSYSEKQLVEISVSALQKPGIA